MKALAVCVAVVALCTAAHLVMGVGSGAYEALLLVGASRALESFVPSGLQVRTGPLNGTVIMFWLDLIAFAIPAVGLYSARRWLGRAYIVLLVAWMVLHLYLLFLAGAFYDSL